MSNSEQGAPRSGFGRVAEQVSGAAGRVAKAATPGQSAGQSAEKSGPSVGSDEPKQTSSTVAAKRTSGAAASRSSEKKPARRPRQARLRLVQVDAWSVMKTAFLLSLALGIVTVVAVSIIWAVLGAAGVFDSVNTMVRTIMGNSFDVQDYLGTGRIMGLTMIVAVVDVFLLTAIATLSAFLYNLAATLLGGVEVTLAEDN